MSSIALIILAFYVGSVICDQIPNASLSVTLGNGDILDGFDVSTVSGARARVFLGVPYAQPPIGELRFQKSRPIRKDHNTRRMECFEYKSNCWQNHSNIDHPIMDLSEDCLYLNIFAGYQCKNDTVCPVLYYIHGGAFEFDAPSMFPVDLLVENFATHGLVLVTVSYRLGVLGFWTTGGKEAVGNYALYDVIQGLKWVKNEIASFGGDPNHVTIMGHSSGATFVSLLMLAPKSRGLFHASVIMSGKPRLSTDLSRYHRLAEDVGCARKMDWLSDHRNDKKILQCMRRIPVDVIVNTYGQYEDIDHGPHTQPFWDGPNGLFPLPLEELAEKRLPYPTMIGTTDNEHGSSKEDYLNATSSSLSQLCKSTIESMRLKRNTRLITMECQRLYTTDALRELKSRNGTALGPGNFSIWTDKMVDMENDFDYFGPVFNEASSIAKTGAKVYLYSFDYVKRGLEGVSPWHAFDLTYVVGLHQFPFDDRDYEIKSIYVPLFVNFAKFGHPTPGSSGNDTWTPLGVVPFDMNYYSIDLPRARMQNPYHYQGVVFWNYVVPTLGGLHKFDHSPQFLAMPRNSDPVQSIDDHQQGTNWYLAFWITLSLTMLAFCALGITVVIIIARKISWTRECPCPRRKSRNESEEETLLSSMKNADSYATFY